MAKNWLDPAEIARDSKVFAAFTIALCGVAAWDVLSTITFDISVVRGKRPWRWPMVLYFVCRVCMLLHIFAFAVNLYAISEIPCQEVTWISKVTDAIGTCCSSLILVLRTRAVWHRDIKVTIPLLLLFLGQIAVWAQTFRYSKAQWNAQRGVCAVISTAPKPLLVTVFAYTMAYDFVILTLISVRLGMGQRTSSLAKLLLRDGIGYFCAAFSANLVQMVFAVLGLNPVMNIMALPLALVVSVIASTTIFRNVFTAYDSFSSDMLGPSISGSKVRSASSNLKLFSGPGRQVNFSDRQTTLNALTGDIALGEYKGQSQHEPSISVHRVVDINVDGVSLSRDPAYMGEKSMNAL